MAADSSISSLPGYDCSIGEDAVIHSQQKLSSASKNLLLFIDREKSSTIRSFPCESNNQTLGYRCKCSFQVTHDDTNDRFHYAMRHKGAPVVLDSSTFPIANLRIQSAMRGLLEHVLNAKDVTGARRYPIIATKNLASLTFAASWDQYTSDGSSSKYSDCIVTMNYDSPLKDRDEWLKEAKQAAHLLSLTQLHGRSRGELFSAVSMDTGGSTSSLRDTVILSQSPETKSWQVTLPNQLSTNENIFLVHYRKPETAFFHPNANVMCQALEWLLDRISAIVAASSTPCRLLEMYCGCGAHTMALAKAGILFSIQAVELDQRLVDACKVNIALNDKESETGGKMTPIRVVQGDAGEWARKLLQLQGHNKKACKETDDDFQILLVDPPRQGLDDKVINMTVSSKFEHVLIISCGHKALVRDLKVLCQHFKIVDCVQLDLFPRMDSVETLVHLKRRQTIFF